MPDFTLSDGLTCNGDVAVSVRWFSIYFGGKLTASSLHQDIKKGYGVILFQFHSIELDPFV